MQVVLLQKIIVLSAILLAAGVLAFIWYVFRKFALPIKKMGEELKNSQEMINLKTRQLRRLNEHIVCTEEQERKTIASDLHDSVSQTLAMSISEIKNLKDLCRPGDEKKLDCIQTYLEQAVREIRSLIYQLSPPVLDDFDIDIALGFLIEETNASKGCSFHYINCLNAPVFLGHSLKVTLYRAVNELISNILKHSGTRSGKIQILKQAGSLVICVEDNGCGFDVSCMDRPCSSGFGLHSLSQRMENFGGRMEIESQIAKGTQVLLTIPLE